MFIYSLLLLVQILDNNKIYYYPEDSVYYVNVLEQKFDTLTEAIKYIKG